jgi:hypothetical protein
MTDSQELDKAALRSEIESIKDAIGINERYGSQFHLWLVYGVLVGLASVGSQAVVSLDLPWWGHWVSWGVLMGVGSVYQWFVSDDTAGGTAEAKPSIGLLYAAVFGYVVVIIAAMSAFLDGSPSVVGSTVFAVFVGGVGTAYLLVGNVLKAYYIRRRDRLAFYVGGGWMLVLAALLPQVSILREWGYGVFGLAFAVHAVGSYIYLR